MSGSAVTQVIRSVASEVNEAGTQARRHVERVPLHHAVQTAAAPPQPPLSSVLDISSSSPGIQLISSSAHQLIGPTLIW